MPPRPDSSGFTMPEAVVALCLLSSLAGAVIGFSRGGLASMERARIDSVSASTLLKLDDLVRGLAERVRVPYWERRAAIRLEAGGASIPYFDGEADSSLDFVWRDRRLSVSAPGISRSFFGLAQPRFGSIEAAAGEIRGLRLEFTLAEKPRLIVAAFGGFAISRAAGGF